MSDNLDTKTGELIPYEGTGDIAPVAGGKPARMDLVPDLYKSFAKKAFNKQAREILLAEPPEEDHDILPTGEVYVSQIRYRRILGEAFGPGGWGLVPLSNILTQGNTLCREYALVVAGTIVSTAIGEAEYYPNNPRMTYATCCESLKSNALTRCCKDIGIASECWDRRWMEQFKLDHCEQARNPRNGKMEWRRKDAVAPRDRVPPAEPADRLINNAEWDMLKALAGQHLPEFTRRAKENWGVQNPQQIRVSQLATMLEWAEELAQDKSSGPDAEDVV